MRSKVFAKALIGIVVIGGGIGYFMFQAMQSSWSYYYSVDDFYKSKESVRNSSLRLAGIVKQGTVNRDVEQMQLNFMLSGTDNEIPVEYSQIVPDNFAEDIEVVVEGRLGAEGTFQAEKLMTRCESKYKAKVN